MAFKKHWATPCLLLAALALLMTGTHASRTITGSLDTTPGQQYDDFTFSIDDALLQLTAPRADPVTVNVMQPIVSGGGLTLRSGRQAVSGALRFEYRVEGAVVTDSRLVLAGPLPSSASVLFANTQATNAVASSVFDFGEMTFANNATVVVRNSYVDYTDAGSATGIVKLGGGGASGSLLGFSSLQVVGMHSTGGACVVTLASSGSSMSVTTVGEGSLLSIDSTTAQGLRRGVLCADEAVTVTGSSILRVTDATLSEGSAAVVDSAVGVVQMSSGSLVVLADVQASSAAVLASQAGSPLEIQVGSGATLSFLDLTAARLCAGCTFTTSGDVYAQNWVLAGSPVSDYAAQGLQSAVALTNLRDGAGQCRPAQCLAANANAMDSSASSCACSCTTASSAPMCWSKPDVVITYQDCADANCVICDVNVGSCNTCRKYYTVVGGACVADCNVNKCVTCAAEQPDTCTECEPGYGLVNGQCVACSVPDCQKCDGDTNSCTQCVNDMTFSPDHNVCQYCADGFARDDAGVCQSICNVANCEVCEEGHPEVCKTCRSTYIKDAAGLCRPGLSNGAAPTHRAGHVMWAFGAATAVSVLLSLL